MTNQTPAGWYPAEGGKVRWWDGNAWTDHYADQTPATMPTQSAPGAPPTTPSASAPAGQPPVGTPPAGPPPVAGVPTPATTPSAPPAQGQYPPQYAGAQPAGVAAGAVPPVPNPGGAPGYAAAAPAAPQKRSLAWLWILLGVLALLFIVGIIVVVAVLIPALSTTSGPSTPTPEPTPTVATSPTADPDPTSSPPDSGSDEEALIAAVNEEFDYWQLSDADIVEIGQGACLAADVQPEITVDFVYEFGKAAAEEFNPEYPNASPDRQQFLAEDGAIIGEFGTFYFCNEYYGPWYDAVDELLGTG